MKKVVSIIITTEDGKPDATDDINLQVTGILGSLDIGESVVGGNDIDLIRQCVYDNLGQIQFLDECVVLATLCMSNDHNDSTRANSRFFEMVEHEVIEYR